MKIKEVSEKTNLTERAIRLYIENGLVAPSFNESYTGRRNVDFSAEDMETLKSISVLRKAGFSIGEIKLMQLQPEKSKDVLREFIDKTSKKIIEDTEIVSCLTPLLSEDLLSPEKICQSLSKPVIEEKSLPPEDSEQSPLQKFIRKLFLALGIVGLIFAASCFVPIAMVEIRDIKDYLYPYYHFSAYIMIFVCMSLILPIPVILLNRKKRHYTGKKHKIKTVISFLLICICVYCGFFTYAAAFLASICSPEGYVISHTHNTENYMLFDVDDAEKAMGEFLPEELPDVKGIKYEYFYKRYGVSHEPPRTEVSLEIPLDEDDFRRTVEYYKAFRPSDSVIEPYEEKINGWTIIFYREDHEYAPTNYTPVFAFNEKEMKVRFICEYGQEYQKGASRHDVMISDYKW